MNYLTYLFITFNLCLCSQAKSQIYDDFSDGNLDKDPFWAGDTAHFSVTDEVLRLNAPDAGQSWLYTPVSITDSMAWEIDIAMDFAPSSSNFGRFYLIIPEPVIPDNPALYLQFGQSGNQDAITLKYTNGTTEQTMLSLNPKIADDPVYASVLVTYHAPGNWSVSATYTAGGMRDDQNSISGFPITDREGYLGIYCKYTSSRVDGFNFDNIAAYPKESDIQKPTIQSMVVVDSNTLGLTYSELMIEASVEDIQFYQIKPGPIEVQSVSIDSMNERLYLINTDRPFQDEELYTLRVMGPMDRSGNILSDTTLTFQYINYFIATTGDLVINEIYPHPTEESDLPPVEFVEIFNTSGKNLILNDATIADKTRTTHVPPVSIKSEDYLLLVDEGTSNLFHDSINVLELTSLPTLNNAGDQIIIENGDVIVDQVNYTSDWYQDPDKQSGGWTLERISPMPNCQGPSNWKACENNTGGTPGYKNSFDNTAFIDEKPSIRHWILVDPLTLQIDFKKSMLNADLLDTSNYKIAGNKIIDVLEIDLYHSKVECFLKHPIDTGEVYLMTISKDLRTCTGMLSDTNLYIEIIVPYAPKPGDLVINEILFEPAPGEAEYVELKSLSERRIGLNGLHLERRNHSGKTDIKKFSSNISTNNGDHPTFTTNRSSTNEHFQVTHPDLLIESKLPNLTNDGGSLRLLRLEGPDTMVIDEAIYGPDIHDITIKDTRGVALERISPRFPGTDPQNWMSAASITGGGSPTSLNSQTPTRSDSGEVAHFFLHSDTFSPDYDNFEDVLILEYRLENPGNKAHIRIFDQAGFCIKHLINNNSLGSSGIVTWSGDTDRGDLADIGLYFVHIQWYGNDGRVGKEIKTAILANK